MAATINIEKTESAPSTPQIINHSDRMQEMESSLKNFLNGWINQAKDLPRQMPLMSY